MKSISIFRLVKFSLLVLTIMIAPPIIVKDSKPAIAFTQTTPPCLQYGSFTYFQRTNYFSDECFTQLVGYTEIDCCYNERTFGEVTQYSTIIDGHCFPE